MGRAYEIFRTLPTSDREGIQGGIASSIETVWVDVSDPTCGVWDPAVITIFAYLDPFPMSSEKTFFRATRKVLWGPLACELA